MEGASVMATSSRLNGSAASGSSPSRAAQALRQSPIPALRKLCVEEGPAGIVISGCVSSYYLKQLAQETVLPILDHQALLNRVLVVRN
jgi:hypothetical protein